ncbi:MAG: hypothetical protein O2904_00010 [bacterium]|nr:hypothetical protein [bacterium]
MKKTVSVPSSDADLTMEKKQTFTVMVDDFFHYQDRSERYKQGEYDTLEEAIAVCKKIVDSFIPSSLEADALRVAFQEYSMFGEDPFIEGSSAFSASKYANQRYKELNRE